MFWSFASASHSEHNVTMEIEENIPLALFTTFHLGGPARFFVRVANLDELREALAAARKHNTPIFILGGGSNTLVCDQGYNGFVIKVEIGGIEWNEEGEHKLLIAGAGVPWDSLVQNSVERGLWGIENLSGIPGTAGAAPIQNIGAYGVEVKDTLEWVEVYDTSADEVKKLSNSECAFGYRSSVFKKDPGRYVVLRSAYRLRSVAAPNLLYRDLATKFSGTAQPSLSEIRSAILDIRANKFPDLSEEGTAGSFFLNPTVSLEEAQRLASLYPELPQFPASNGIKISLAWVLDKLLNLRGFAIGGARLFEKQPLVVVAKKNCSTNDVLTLSAEVQRLVKEKINIEIEKEVRVI